MTDRHLDFDGADAEYVKRLSDDWQVVEEALDRAAATCTRPELARIQDAKDRLARLREREAQYPQSWREQLGAAEQRAEAAEARAEDYWKALQAEGADREAAEARVAEWEDRCDRMADLEQKASARVAQLEEAVENAARIGWERGAAAEVARLEEALEDIQALPQSEAWERARSALAHEEAEPPAPDPRLIRQHTADGAVVAHEEEKT